MPIYPGRRRKGTWRVVVSVKGKNHEWIVEGLKRDAEVWEAKKRVELAADPLALRAATSFEEFSNVVYAAHAEKHLASSTWNSSRIYQVATLVEFFGHLRLNEITATDIEQFKAARLEKKTKHTSINNELRVLKTILRFAKDLGPYDVAIPKWVRLPERGQGRVKTWTTAELHRLFECVRIDSPEILPMIVFLANSGCRKGEAIACEWDWIDDRAELIRIPSNDYWQPKNGKPREVPLANAVRLFLSRPRAHKRWVFPAAHGERYLHFPEDQFRRAKKLAKLSGGPHKLRHSFASHFLQRCPDLFLLAQILGHSSTRVTELYAHLLPDHLARAKGAVDIAPPLRTLAEPLAESPVQERKPRHYKKLQNKRH